MKSFFKVSLDQNKWSLDWVHGFTRIGKRKLQQVMDGMSSLDGPEAVLLGLLIGCQPEDCHQAFDDVSERYSRTQQPDPWSTT